MNCGYQLVNFSCNLEDVFLNSLSAFSASSVYTPHDGDVAYDGYSTSHRQNHQNSPQFYRKRIEFTTKRYITLCI